MLMSHIYQLRMENRDKFTTVVLSVTDLGSSKLHKFDAYVKPRVR